MLLTIGMIVKNEERYLRDCLNSIKPLLDELDSELIIYDTGSKDATVEISKEFTDQVYTLEWRGDFAWARNHTVDRAKGKWYMWVDADEIYQDVSGIIKFLTSPESEEYNRANVIWKNLHNHGTTFSIFHPSKLFKLHEGMRWSGKIHEVMNPTLLPCKLLKDVVALHYGYNYDTPEDLKIKSMRNLPPLLERYEEDPNDPKNILQLISEYRGAGLRKKSREFIEKGLALFADNKYTEYYHVFAKDFTENCFCAKEYETALEFIQDFFANAPVFHANAHFIKHDESQCLHNMKRYKESADAAIGILKWMSKAENGKLSTHINSMFVAYNLSREMVIKYLIILNYAKAGEFDFALGWQKNYPDLLERTEIFSDFAQLAITEEKWGDLTKLYEYAKKLKVSSVDYDNAMSTLENSIAKSKKLAATAFVEQCTDMNDEYVCLQKLRSDYAANEDILEYFLKCGKPFHQRFCDVVFAAMIHKKDFNMFLKNLQIINTTEIAVWIINTHEDSDSILLDYLQSMEDRLSVKSLYLVLNMLAVLKPLERADIVDAYARINHKYSSLVYRSEIYSIAKENKEEQIWNIPRINYNPCLQKQNEF